MSNILTEPDLRTLKEIGAVLEGHFLLASGRHSPIYIEKFRILEEPRETDKFAQRITAHFKDYGIRVVAGPTTGGVVVAYEVARQLGARSIYAEREGVEGYARVFRRGFKVAANEPVLVVDDILTTGTSIRPVIEMIKDAGGHVVGAAVFIDRSERDPSLGVPLFASLEIKNVPTYLPSECPQCRNHIPLDTPGRGSFSEADERIGSPPDALSG